MNFFQLSEVRLAHFKSSPRLSDFLTHREIIKADIPLLQSNMGRQFAECSVILRHSQLSNEQILLALSESYNIVAAITKYQVFLASGIGLPKDDVARSEIMSASINVVEKIRTEIRALEHELDRREKQEKGRS
jgi:hypothetical protein